MGKTRIHLELAEDAYERMDKMKNLAEHRSKTDVVRDALRVYEFLLTEYKEYDADFYIQRKGDEREKVRLFMS